ncbi:Uma2 family endonuclease [Haloactinospora alba]|nr:Uma2 family endonuclease [Haloactinospora alba]
MGAVPATERPEGQQRDVTWPVPPPGGFTAEDLDRLPDLPPHTELIDGSLVFVSPQKNFHSLVLSLLETGVRACSPSYARVRREMSVRLGARQRPEPDVLVVRDDAVVSMEQTYYSPDAVLLAVEVVSPDSEERDRYRKPELYAAAGIPHFWRVEEDDGAPVVYVYERDPATRSYALTGIHRHSLKLEAPFEVEVDLTGIDRM